MFKAARLMVPEKGRQRTIAPCAKIETQWGAIARETVQNRRLSYKIVQLAERVGFEPTVQFPAHTLSKRAP